MYKRLNSGILASNCYIVWDKTRSAAIIDAGNPLSMVETVVNENALNVKYIILTHAHLDHMYYLPDIRACYPDAKAVCHEEDAFAFSNPEANASVIFGSARRYEKPDMTVRDGDILHLGMPEESGSASLEIVSTPGHMPGAICVKMMPDKLLFTGDTLFYGGFGRTDLGYGDVGLLSRSIDKLYSMDKELVILPGHGTHSTIGKEAVENPFMDF